MGFSLLVQEILQDGFGIDPDESAENNKKLAGLFENQSNFQKVS